MKPPEAKVEGAEKAEKERENEWRTGSASVYLLPLWGAVYRVWREGRA